MKVLRDMREFIDKLEEIGELVRISREVDADNFELSSYIRHMEDGPNKAILFERVKGYTIPVVANLFGSPLRLAIGCGIDPSEEDIKRYWKDPHGSLGSIGGISITGYTLTEKERAALVMLRNKILDADENALTGKYSPKIVDNGLCKEIIVKKEDVDLSMMFPFPRFCEKDAGPYINPGALVQKDPDTGILDIGCRRHLVKPERYGKDKIGAFIVAASYGGRILRKYQDRGLSCEVALCIGLDPITEIVNCYTFPHHDLGKPYGDYDIIGALMGEPLEVVKCETVDLLVPANSEIVIEGVIPPKEMIEEGPMAEFTEMYAQTGPLPFIEITAITHRRNPIMHALMSGRSEEHRTLSIPTVWGYEQMALKAVKKVFPNVKDMAIFAGSHCFHLVVSMKKRFEGDDKLLLHHLMGTTFYKYITIVDDDIEPHNSEEVEWAKAMRAGRSPEDFVIFPGLHTFEMDPEKDQDSCVTRLGILATLPFGETFSRTGPPEEMLKKTKVAFEEEISLYEAKTKKL